MLRGLDTFAVGEACGQVAKGRVQPEPVLFVLVEGLLPTGHTRPDGALRRPDLGYDGLSMLSNDDVQGAPGPAHRPVVIHLAR
jgi:hypothetical protein